jgi:hypothetical protein
MLLAVEADFGPIPWAKDGWDALEAVENGDFPERPDAQASNSPRDRKGPITPCLAKMISKKAHSSSEPINAIGPILQRYEHY